MPTKQEFIKLAKFYLYLVLLGSFVYLMEKPPSAVTMNNNLIETAKLSVQSIIVNSNIKQVGMLFLLLYTAFVVIESLSVIRDCARRLYYKSKGNNVVE